SDTERGHSGDELAIHHQFLGAAERQRRLRFCRKGCRAVELQPGKHREIVNSLPEESRMQFHHVKLAVMAASPGQGKEISKMAGIAGDKAGQEFASRRACS